MTRVAQSGVGASPLFGRIRRLKTLSKRKHIMNDYEIGLAQFMLFAQSLGIGFLIGLERERHEDKIAGVRSFTLIALLGALSGYLSTALQMLYAPWVLLPLIVISFLAAQFRAAKPESDTTSVIAAVITFLLGHILWFDDSLLPAALAIAVTAVLYFREELRDLPRRLTRQDILSFFQFAAIAFILLPILPDQTYGPYAVFNPYQVGWLVVLISGISLAGYVALRLIRGKQGLFVVGLLGGLVSTTATTLVYSRHSQRASHFATSAATIILLSHLMLFIRVAVVTAVVQTSMLKMMLPWIIGGLGAGLICLMILLRYAPSAAQQLPELEVSNPAELKTALGFALGFTVVLLLSAWMNDVFQNTGAYVVAFFSGLTDMDAITIANMKLFAQGTIDAKVAVIAIVIAFIANLMFKLGITLTVGDRQLRKPMLIGFSLLLIGVVGGLSLSLSAL